MTCRALCIFTEAVSAWKMPHISMNIWQNMRQKQSVQLFLSSTEHRRNILFQSRSQTDGQDLSMSEKNLKICILTGDGSRWEATAQAVPLQLPVHSEASCRGIQL